jgi:hypothetical protein
MLEGRRRRIAQLALVGKKINTGHNGGRYPKDCPPEMRHRTAKLTTQQQIEASTAAWAAERKKQKKEQKEIRRLMHLVFRGADAALVRNPRDPARREALIARAHEAALELQRRWSGPK